ncbi:MAG TPA: hypothetical protein VFI27_21225 [candidate division Zixibacteria bacterium]|nr:hypothetical protein [candidate division Zixibacteria bacterium]
MNTRRKSITKEQRSAFVEAGIVTLCYLLIIAIITWPTIARLATHMPGTSTDTLLHYWNGWWVRDALSKGQSPFFTPILFFPNGVSLVTHNFAWLNILPWIVLAPLVGDIPAYNLVLLGSLLFGGWAAYILAKRLTLKPWAALIAGVIYIAWPNRISQLDHPNLIATWAVPIFMIGLINLLEKRRWQDALLTGGAYALTGYSRWQNLIPVTAMGMTYFLLRIRDWWPIEHRRIVLGRTLFAAVIAVLLLLPPIILLASDMSGDGGGADVFNESDEFRMQTDLLAYVTPPRSNPLFGEWSQPLYDSYYPDRSFDRRYPAFIGFMSLLLAVLALWKDRRNSLPWLGVCVVLVGLAAGPVLRINGDFFEGAPTLYKLLAPLSIVRLIRVPDRFNIFLALPVAMLAALGFRVFLAMWTERYPRFSKVWPKLWTVVFIVFITAEYLIIPARGHDVSYDKTFYEAIAAEPGDFAVLNLPFRRGKEYMFDQTFHTRPIVQGNASRLPDDALAFVYKNPWLAALKESFPYPIPNGDVGEQLFRLANDGIGYLVIHKDLLDINLVNHWKRYLVASPRYEDERVAIYSTKPQVGVDLDSLYEPVDGLNQVAASLPSNCWNPGQVIGLNTAWANSMPLTVRYEVQVSLVNSNGATKQMTQFPLTDLEPNETWPVQTITQGYYSIPLDPVLPDGEYHLKMQLIRIPQGTQEGGAWCIGEINVQSNPCRLPAQKEDLGINATYGDELLLQDLQINQEGHQLALTMSWLSLREMVEDYKIFIHLIDPVSGMIVSQIDAMPVNWQYPTSLWWPGNPVVDTMTLDLDGVASGSYLLSVGVYAESTGERLEVVDSQGLKRMEGSLQFPHSIQYEFK